MLRRSILQTEDQKGRKSIRGLERFRFTRTMQSETKSKAAGSTMAAAGLTEWMVKTRLAVVALS